VSFSKYLLVTLAALFLLNETEIRSDIISLKGLDVMDKSASELSGYPYCSPNGVQNRRWKRWWRNPQLSRV